MTKKSDDDVKVGGNFVASFGVEILKAEESEDGKTGRVKALVSAYNVEYRMGGFFRPVNHLIHDGAFDESIKAQTSIPIFWQHNWDWSEQPPIGTGIPSEQGKGLMVTSDFFLDIEAGRSVFNAIKAKALREWSIGYRIIRHEVEEKDDGTRIIHVKQAELLEASSVLRGANPETETLEVARQMPAEVREALDAISEFMQAQKSVNEMLTKNAGDIDVRLDAIEVSHDILLGSLEDAGFKLSTPNGETDDKSEEKVEPAGLVGAGEDPGTAASQESEAPEPSPEPSAPATASSESEDEEKDMDIDDLFDRAQANVLAKRAAEVNEQKQDIVDRAGRLLPGDETEGERDLESMTRVLGAMNKAQYIWDSVEARTEAETLAKEGQLNSELMANEIDRRREMASDV